MRLVRLMDKKEKKDNKLQNIRIMMTEKTKNIRYKTLYCLGFVIFIAGIIIWIITLCSDLIPRKDLAWAFVTLGGAIGLIGESLGPITNEESANGPGCFIFSKICFLLLFPLAWLNRIEHFTALDVTLLVIAAILIIVAAVLTFRKARQIRALAQQEDEDEKKQE